MTDDQFTRLFKRIEDGFTAMNERLDQTATKDDLDRVYNLLDRNISEHQRQEDERAAMSHQLDRLDRWVHEIAEQTGTKLNTE